MQDFIEGKRVSARLAPKLARILSPTPEAYQRFLRQWEQQDDQHLREAKKRDARKKAMLKMSQKFYAEVEFFQGIEEQDSKPHFVGLMPYVDVFTKQDTEGENPILTIYSHNAISFRLGQEEKCITRDLSFEEELWLYKDYCQRKHWNSYGLIELARQEVLTTSALNPETYERSNFILVPTHQFQRWQKTILQAADALVKEEKERDSHDRFALSNLSSIAGFSMESLQFQAKEAEKARAHLLETIYLITTFLSSPSACKTLEEGFAPFRR